MWSSIADLKENLNKISLDVHDDYDEEDELSIHGYDSLYSDRRRSHSLVHSKSPSDSPIRMEMILSTFPRYRSFFLLFEFSIVELSTQIRCNLMELLNFIVDNFNLC